jgi:hypothetical protein
MNTSNKKKFLKVFVSETQESGLDKKMTELTYFKALVEFQIVKL